MKLFLDDERAAPPGWTLVRTPEEAIGCLAGGAVEEISLDHDMGTTGALATTGYTVLLWIEERVALVGFRPPKMRVHSANPSARLKMVAAIAQIEKMAEVADG